MIIVPMNKVYFYKRILEFAVVPIIEKIKNKVLPRFELGLLDSKSKVLTITP